MTETEILKLLRDDFKGVTTSVNNLSGEVAGMKSTLKGVDDTLKEHKTAIKETREAQLRCKASGGWENLNREMKDVKRKQSDYRVHVESEIKYLREDATGQFDVPIAPIVAAKTNGGMVAGFFKTFGPWIVAGLIGLGAYLGSGGDEEKTMQVLRNLREIGLKVEKIEQNHTEPVRIPVPVTASACYSEEMLP